MIIDAHQGLLAAISRLGISLLGKLDSSDLKSVLALLRCEEDAPTIVPNTDGKKR